MIGLDESSMKIGPFEALCQVAGDERWCWNISCTTCGHQEFRWAFKAIARGHDPRGADWPVHRTDGRLAATMARLFEPAPRFGGWPVEEQLALQNASLTLNLRRLADRVSFPDWLGHIGLLLSYTEDGERLNGRLTSLLVPQLVQLVRSGTDALPLLEGLLVQRTRLSWQHLETVESAYAGPRPWPQDR